MHAILITLGTDGDVFPYVGLGVALRSRGHRVTLVASAHYEALAAAHELGFRALVSAEENDALFGHPDFWHPRKTVRLQLRWGLRLLQRNYELLSKLITNDAVLLAVPALLAVGLAHEKLGTPLISVVLQPWMIPSAIAPPLMTGLLPLRGAPPFVWKMIWAGSNVAGDIFIGRHVNRVRVSLGLKPVRGFFRNWLSRQLVLGLFPDWYGAPQTDWPPQIRLMGFPLYDGGPSGELPPQIEEFCRAGASPIAFTFGTGMVHPGRLFRDAVEACAITGRRGILLTKFPEKLPQALPTSIAHCAFAPFKTLFPLCAAVVHHGGVGTVAEAIAAGIPQLIRPLCFDQVDNGERARRLGVGDWLKPRKVDGKLIAEALT
ncbi:MAG TPA: nucleotide disphospho-sugar-binding domain-containing protein, partial [Verrucomicrobiae bacterium]|nr:nucleotide disphospho-sugar-binding domain-containing protein [Verrucomicrobiae bacterium]